MRVLIMSDMEGVSGIVVWEQVNGGAPMFEEGRKLYTEEINAAVRGAKAAGATEIVAVDCHGAGKHWSFNSFIPDLLDPDCDFVNHHAWSRYTEILEQGCDAVLLVGMHAKANTPDGVLCHTVSSTSWRSFKVNGQEVGEVGINAALCGHYGCPVLLVTGDTATCNESQDLLGGRLTAVAVKRGLTRFSARNIAPKRAREMIEEGAYRALQDLKAVDPYVPAKPTILEIELGAVDHAAQYRGRPGVEIIDDLKVISTAGDWLTAWNQIWHW